MSDEMPPIINVDENITGVSSHDIDGKKTITGQSMREHVEANWPYKYIRADLHRAEIAREFVEALNAVPKEFHYYGDILKLLKKWEEQEPQPN